MTPCLFHYCLTLFERGMAMTGLSYRAIDFGPVPDRWDRVYSEFASSSPTSSRYSARCQSHKPMTKASPLSKWSMAGPWNPGSPRTSSSRSIRSSATSVSTNPYKQTSPDSVHEELNRGMPYSTCGAKSAHHQLHIFFYFILQPSDFIHLPSISSSTTIFTGTPFP